MNLVGGHSRHSFQGFWVCLWDSVLLKSRSLLKSGTAVRQVCLAHNFLLIPPRCVDGVQARAVNVVNRKGTAFIFCFSSQFGCRQWKVMRGVDIAKPFRLPASHFQIFFAISSI